MSAMRGQARPSTWGTGILLVLAGLLVLAHGCHNHDTDDELAWFLPRRQLAGRGAPPPAPGDSAPGCPVANEAERLP